MENIFGKYILKILPCVYSFTISKKELSLQIPFKYLIQIFTVLKYHTNTQFKVLSDICVVDYPSKKNRFEIIYNMLSLHFNSRLRIKVSLNEYQKIPSLTSLYLSSNWWEREIFDMFGLQFKEHPDLRRILTDYGFEGYPLRKDYPLSGFLEVRYCEKKKRIVYEKTIFSQEYRQFNFDNSWV